MFSFLLHRPVASVVLGGCLSLAAAAHAAAQSVAAPHIKADADAVLAVPQGWLSMEPHALVLRDAKGKALDQVAVRGEILAARSLAKGAQGASAWVLDGNTQQPMAVDVYGQKLRLHAPFAAPSFEVAAMCALRDQQGHEFLFVLSEDGQGEQWLVQKGQAKKYRTFIAPPGVTSCQIDDASGTMIVTEAAMGAWSYAVGEEQVPERQPVALRKPMGSLSKGAGAAALLPGGVAVMAANGKAIHLLRAEGDAWKSVAVLPLPSEADAEVLSVQVQPKSVNLLWKDDNDGTWHAIQHPWVDGKLPSQWVQPPLPVVKPVVQTDGVLSMGDAADDPAIWIHPTDAAQSLVLGTNKKQGLHVYNLKGKEQQFLNSGRINNVDVRQQVRFGDEYFDLAVATQRDDLSLVLYNIEANGTVSEVARLHSGLKEIYGMCLYQPAQGGLEIFANDKSGEVQHQRVVREKGQWKGEVVRTLHVGSQPEGCVVDDAGERLFLGEEDVGVWVTSASARTATPFESVMKIGPYLHDDVEGLAIYYGRTDGKLNGHNYLVISSQGNHSYVVLDAQAPYTYRGAFRVGINEQAGIDAASETDGLDVTSVNLGGPFSEGMLVVQDGFKRLPDGPQNFKLVPWSDVKSALNLPW